MTKFLVFTVRKQMGTSVRTLVAALLIFGLSERGETQESRIIIVNGDRLNAQEILQVDQLNCGDPVPNGNYWMDFQRRRWGYVGKSGSAPLPDCSDADRSQPSEADQPKPKSACERKYRIHEDRMCYCYRVC
jgi:hypothetical protein